MRHVETSRNTEALMSAAGYPPVTSRADSDILVERFGEDEWIVTMISPPALKWASAELCCALRQCFTGHMRLDMMSADRLLKQAHDEGFKVEFTGRSGKDFY
jgi:hypothetical protein